MEDEALIESILLDAGNLCTIDELRTQNKQCMRMFEDSDADGNGVLTFGEISRLCGLMGVPMRGDENEMLRKMDSDDSGTLEKSEWRVWWLRRISRMPSPEKQQRVMAKHIFAKFDTDNSGSMDASEFHGLCNELGAAFSAEEIDAALDMLDSDGNGVVDRDEFVQWWVDRTKNEHSGGVVGLKLKKLASKARAIFHTDIHTAVWLNDISLVRLFLESERRLAKSADPEEHSEGFTPLHYACYNGNMELVDMLLDAAGSKAANITNDVGFTPLFYAAQQGHIDICKKLIDMHGADPTICGAITISDPSTGDVSDTGRVLCPVDHCVDWPELRSVFENHERCHLPEIMESQKLHVSFSRSGLLMITHPSPKALSKLPINAWRLRCTFKDGGALEFDVTAHRELSLSQKRFEYTVSRQDIKIWIKVHRKKVYLEPQEGNSLMGDREVEDATLENELVADSDTKDVQDSEVESKEETALREATELAAKSSADVKLPALELDDDGLPPMVPGAALAMEEEAQAKRDAIKEREEVNEAPPAESSPRNRRIFDPEEEARKDAEAAAAAEVARIQKEKDDAIELASIKSNRSFGGGGGRVKVARAKRAAAKAETEKDNEPDFKWVVTAVEPLLVDLRIGAVNAMGVGPMSEPVMYDWLHIT